MAWDEKLPSGKYRGLYRLPNGQKRSAGTYPHKETARKAAVAAEAKVLRTGWRDPREGMITWGDWHDIWWPSRVIEPATKANEASMVRNHIMPKWRDAPLAGITRQEVQAWATSLTTTNIGTEEDPRYRKPSTASRVLDVFTSSMTAAIDAELIDKSPAIRIKLPPNPISEPVFLTRDQYAQLRVRIPRQQDRALVDFLVGTGMRWGEVAGLHLHNLDLQKGYVTVIDVTDGAEIKPYPKGRKKRYVPLFQWVVDDLEVPDPSPCGVKHRHRRTCPSGLVFPASAGGVRDDRNFYHRVLVPALKAAGLDGMGLTIHDLRHTYASWLAMDGVPLGRIAELLGHASIRTTEIYAHFAQTTGDDIAHAMRDPRASERGADVGQTAATPRITALRALN